MGKGGWGAVTGVVFCGFNTEHVGLLVLRVFIKTFSYKRNTAEVLCFEQGQETSLDQLKDMQNTVFLSIKLKSNKGA